ncbi:hypothetical protein ACIBJE_19020 [Micromonospora sp. NPDC050187]|uniref:hypothetical protein n=1 Tax=Micromonospora sp. NPDC050187 TaxID=3364277 RepID=UPI0037B99157
MTMINRTAVRRRSLSRVSYAVGLLVLIGVATALVVVVRVPAHSTTHLTAPLPPGPSAHGVPPAVGGGHPEGHRPGVGGGQRIDVPSPPARSEPPDDTVTEAGRLARARSAGPGAPGDAAETLHRSLVLSGLLGLTISLTGLVIVGSRRRMW